MRPRPHKGKTLLWTERKEGEENKGLLKKTYQILWHIYCKAHNTTSKDNLTPLHKQWGKKLKKNTAFLP